MKERELQWQGSSTISESAAQDWTIVNFIYYDYYNDYYNVFMLGYYCKAL